MYGDPEKYFVSHGEFGPKADRLRGLVHEIRARTGQSDPSILDVGSGRGELLEAARREGVSVAVGLELSRAMIASAAEHGLVVLEATAEDYVRDTDRQFDCVVLAAVLEHVEDPDSLLEASARLLRPGGVVYIDVPRDPNIVTMAARLAAALRRSPAVLNLSPTFSPFHVFGFTPKSLARLLSKRGFDLEELVVEAAPFVPHRDDIRDRLSAIAASLMIRAGNHVGLAPNMTAWARRLR
jgi:2-polyprenyl-3-methyl-5-hydroxy-6-metoxy-1,4-benzoquinol methylase